MKAIRVFIKYGSKEHMTALFEQGVVYLNTIEHFRKEEEIDKLLRGDRYEGVGRIANATHGTITFPWVDRPLPFERYHVAEMPEIAIGNLFCIYCISPHTFPNAFDFKIDPRVFDFGEYCVIIKDTATFLKRVQKALTKEGYKSHEKVVQYYDKEKINGIPSVFQKSLEYEYQKEHRIYVESDKVEPIVIKIDSIADIAELHRSSDTSTIELLINGKKINS